MKDTVKKYWYPVVTISSGEPWVAPSAYRFFPRVRRIEYRIRPIRNRTNREPH